METSHVPLFNPHALQYGLHGHRHAAIVDGRAFEQHRDGRVKPANTHARTCIRHGPIGGKRTRGFMNPVLSGTSYAATMPCLTCGIVKPSAMFDNMAIHPDDRRLNGKNLHCRRCQKTQYENGYRLDDFVVSDDEDMEDEEDEDEDDEDVYEVEEILDYVSDPRTGALSFLIKWQGYPDEQNTWEPEEHLSPELVQEFLASV